MKILYVATVSNTINAFMIPHIKMLINQGIMWILHAILKMK